MHWFCLLSQTELKCREAVIGVPGNHKSPAPMGRLPCEVCSRRDWHSPLKGSAERALELRVRSEGMPSEPTYFRWVSLLSPQRRITYHGLQNKSAQGRGWVPGPGLSQSKIFKNCLEKKKD